MECTEDEAALRSKIRTNLRVTRVFVLNASAVCQTPTVMMVSLSVVPFPKVLITNIHLALTVISYSVFHQSVVLVAVPVLRYHSFMSIRHLHRDGQSLLTVLTVTPIDRLHDGDGSNGVKGAAEEGKL